MRILVTPTTFSAFKDTSAALERLHSFSDEVVYNDTGKPLAGQDLIDRLKGCDGMIAGVDYLHGEVLDQCDGLKVISRYGVGYDRVDLDAAARKGIVIANTPGMNANAVADLAMGLVLSTARKIPYLDRTTREGEWLSSKGIEIYGKTMGIIGLGAIGKGVAKRARGFDMDVLAYDPYMDKEYAEKNGITPVSFEELVSRSHVISLHLPLNEQTRHMINEKTISSMREGAIIVNTSRGGIVDEAAVCAALQSGKLGGLGLDVFEEEPADASRFLPYDNAVLTPHKGSHTREAMIKMMDCAVDNLIKVLSGEACANIVNQPAS